MRYTEGNPEWERQHHLTRSSSQSLRRIRSISPAHGSSHSNLPWEINAHRQSLQVLTIKHMGLTSLTYAIKVDMHLCRYDYLMITSINNDNSLNLGKHCGNKAGQTALVTGDYAVLTFHTDEVQERKGFLLFFSVFPEGKLNQKTVRFFRAKELPRRKLRRLSRTNRTGGGTPYTGGLRPKGVSFTGFRYIKG